MSTKNSKKPALLPSLNALSPDAKREFLHLKGPSPNKTANQFEFLDLDKDKSLNLKSVKRVRVGTTGANLQFRSISLAGPIDFKKRGFNLNGPETPGASIMGATSRKDETIKKIALWEKVAELKANFSRFYDNSEIPPAPTKADIRRVINCLEALSDNLIDLMNIVVQVLKSALYVNYSLIEPFEERVGEECGEEFISFLNSCKKDGTPYHMLCLAMVRELTSESRASQKQLLHIMEINRLQSMISDNRNMLQELNADLNERVPSAEYARIVKEFETLTKRHRDTDIENQALRQAINEATEENHVLRKQVEADTTEIDKGHALVQLLEKARDNVYKETEDSRKQIVQMKEKIKGFKDILDRIIIKLGNVKQQVIDLRQENEELIYQNERLSLRAARGFDSLTPRADYRKLIEEKKLEMDVYDPTGRRQLIPTIKIVEELTNRLHTLAEKNKGEVVNKRKDKLLVPKSGQGAKPTPQLTTKRSSLISPSKPAANKSNPESAALSDSAQKSFFPNPIGGLSPHNGQASAGGESDHKTENSPIKHLGDNEAEENIATHVTENDEQLNKSQSRNTLTNITAKIDSSMKEGEKDKELFGEDTIKQANELINFVVDTKKAIDKFD